MFADRLAMAASRFLAAAVANVILLFCVAESPESYWSGCIKIVMVTLSRLFLEACYAKNYLNVKLTLRKNLLFNLLCKKKMRKKICV